MCELQKLLAVAPRRAPFTSDDVIQPCLGRRDKTANVHPKSLTLLVAIFFTQRPNGTWREFTRWLA